MIRIELAKTLLAAKKAKEEGRLAAFRKEDLDCQYRYDGLPGVCCAIGAGISDDEAAKLSDAQMGSALNDLVTMKVFSVESGTDKVILIELQERHDIACSGTQDRPARRAAFTRYLNAQIAKLPAEALAA